MPAAATAYLVTRREGGLDEILPLDRKVRYTLGRSPGNRIRIQDDLASREHAEIAFEEGRWYVRDLGSLNGSRVNDELVREKPWKLDPNDEIQVGRSHFIFVEDLDDLPPIPQSPKTKNDEQIEIKKRLRSTRYIPVPSSIKKPEASNEGTIADSRRSEQALAVLYRLALDMGSVSSLEELTDVVLDGLLEGVPGELVAVTALKESRDQELLAHRYRDSTKKTYHKVSQFVSSEVIQHREAILAENVALNPQLKNRESLTDLKANSLICTPVIFGEDLLGLIHIYSTALNHALTQENVEFAMAVARQFGAAWFQLQRQDRQSSLIRELKDSLRLESELVGASDPLKLIETQISRVAATNATVLIRGESGSGKELVARAIHFSSPRREGAYVCLNCAALTETLLESELFGHERGAYTGATEKMIGKFEAADKGTIFLDEIGEMPMSTQSKFLRVLEGHPFERLGGNNSIKVDVRVVAATNRPLEEAVRSGQFRKDLFFRLQVVEIRVPPLRERLDDIPVLADHFLKRFVRETGRKIKGFTPQAIDKLQAYHWPGNVRELRNVIERAVALSGGNVLDATDIWLSSLDLDSPKGIAFEPISLEEMERRHIQAMLTHTLWNKSQAAELLGIERSTLDRKIKAYEIKKD
jgi:transcriptional regulator with GAF, ATPase, and Fis domain